MKILGIIPARGGSKGVPGKNIKSLAGKPLIGYSIAAGKQSLLDRVIVSTDSEEIANVAKTAGAEVPFLRPAELAKDASPTIDAVIHALRYFAESGEMFDAVCLLQPSCPFRVAGEIDDCITLFAKSGADSLVTVRPIPEKYNPWWAFGEVSKGLIGRVVTAGEFIPSRQKLPRAYYRDGSVYISRTSLILNQNLLVAAETAYRVNTYQHYVNIDDMSDWIAAEEIARSGAICF